MRRLVTLSALLALALSPAPASACVLNNQSSLSANGYAASKNLDQLPTAASFVPFVFLRVYGFGQSIHFSENFSDLRKSLSAHELSHPFLWRWGDGTATVGRSPGHVYTRTGSYVLSVYAFGTAAGGDAWTAFDKARITVVPPGEVWRDNLGQDALNVVGAVFKWTIWSVLAGVAALLAWGFFTDWRGGRKRRLSRPTQQPEGPPAG